MKTKYAFIDRDGTLIYEPQDTFYVDSIDVLKISPGMIDYLRKLIKDGYKLIMITNQDHLGTDVNPHHVFEMVQDELAKRLDSYSITFDQVLVCPHGPDDDCDCRKPKTGMVKHITDINKDLSIVLGDRDTDMEFARNLGVKGIKVAPNEGAVRLLLNGKQAGN